jgi:serine protease Do
MGKPYQATNRHTFSQCHRTAWQTGSPHGTTLACGLLVRSLLLISMLCLLLAAFIRDGKNTYASTFRTNDDPVRTAVDLAKPAIVRIITTVNGRLIVHFPTGDVTFPQTGGTYNMQLSGTGTFISAHGDILTADHVVSPPPQVLAEAAVQDITAYINQHNLAGTPVTMDDVNQAIQSSQLHVSANYGAKSSEIYLDTDYTGPLSTTTIQNIPPTLHKTVDRIEKESSFDQEDVAIVHVPFNDMASVPFGDSSTVQQQDQLTIIGFPGNGDVSTKPTDLLTSSVNKLTVSSFKTTDSGAPLIQVGGNVEQGDSGGPALDSSGNIVGIASFYITDGSQGQTSFLRASASAQKLISALNLDLTPGNFQRKWHQAFTDYSATTPGHWHKTAQELASIATAYPLFRAITPYQQNAQLRAKTEPMPVTHPQQTPNASRVPSLPLIIWIVAIATLLLLSTIICVSALRYRSRRKTHRIAPAAFHSGYSSDAHLSQQNSIRVRPPMGPIPPKDNPKATHVISTPPFPLSPTQSLVSPSWAINTPEAVNAINPPDAICLWPCRHMNRPDAHFCRICGKPALLPSTQHNKVET